MKNITPELLSSLISDIYDCAIDPQGWGETLKRFAYVMDAEFASINLASLPYQDPVLAAHSPWDDRELLRLNRDYNEDVPGVADVAYGALDTPLSTADVMSEAEFFTTRFYQEWAQPQGLRDACMCKVAQTGDRLGIVAAITGAGRDIVSAQEHAFMQLLAPHFRRSVMIGDLLEQQRGATHSYRQLIDAMSNPVILTDRRGKVHQINAAAEAILEQAQSLCVVDGYLQPGKTTVTAIDERASTRSRVASLSQAVELAAQGDTPLGRRGIGLALQSSGEPPLIAYVLPLQVSAVRSAFNPAAVAIFLCTRDNSAPVADAVLATLYELTPTEIRVVKLLAQGQSTKAIARLMGVTDHTITTHTKHIYAKTGANKQSQLVALVAAHTPPVAL
jgi:DNA-binding CsgD family transcriptional regulator/PAS domain-containing protein